MPLHEHEYEDEQPVERRRPLVARYYDEQADRRAHTRQRVPESAAALPAYRGRRLVVDDDGGLTPAWVVAQRRPMAPRIPLSNHTLGLSMPRQQGRPPIDTMHFDLTDETRVRWREAFEQLAHRLAPLFDSLNDAAERVGKTFGELAAVLQPPNARPPLALRESDPMQYALELRRTRSTGPSRPNAQTARRPRLHR